MQQFGNWSNFLGIAVMNEPSMLLEENHHEELRMFYVAAYDIVRRYSQTSVVAITTLYQQHREKWVAEFSKPPFYNVLVDWCVSFVTCWSYLSLVEVVFPA